MGREFILFPFYIALLKLILLFSLYTSFLHPHQLFLPLILLSVVLVLLLLVVVIAVIVIVIVDVVELSSHPHLHSPQTTASFFHLPPRSPLSLSLSLYMYIYLCCIYFSASLSATEECRWRLESIATRLSLTLFLALYNNSDHVLSLP